ncbi:hypothetical protein [Ciceribacter azotifigens]|uniref:hypothetical protein n=1 Tax=Ciceribacter azotifigens TaxID=2069303 RepID=UPI003A83C2F1
MADNPIQEQMRELQAQIRELRQTLGIQGERAAGQLRGRAAAALEGASRTAGDAAQYARDEAATVAGVVREHPAATSTALLMAGLIGGLVGYFIATSSEAHHRSHYRWY